MDALLDINIVVDVCAKRAPFLHDAIHALKILKEGKHRIWLYTGSVQTLHYVLAREIQSREEASGRSIAFAQAQSIAREMLIEFSRDVQWLAGLADDGAVFDSNDPEDAQLKKAVSRLGEGARLITRDQGLLDSSAQAISPSDFLSLRLKDEPLQFIDLHAQQDQIRPSLENRIHRVLHHGQYILGPEIAELEKQLATFVGVKHAVTCASGTDGLLMALMACGIGPGDAVFTTPFTFIATAEVISLLGATPIFADVDPRTFNVDPDQLEQAIERVKREGNLRPCAVIPVDLFGLPADYDRINEIAHRHQLRVIEDAAQSFGAACKGKRAGSLAEIGVTSFFPAKPLGCYGDGGAIFTDNDEVAADLQSIRVHGKGRDKYDNIRIGVNGRMDTLQAAIVLSKLEIFSAELESKQRVADVYSERLRSAVETPYVPDGCQSAWAQYSFLTDRRSEIQQTLKAAGIPSMVYYPTPLHLQTAFKSLCHKPGDFPVSENTSARILCLPMHPYLAMETVEGICERVLEGVGGRL